MSNSIIKQIIDGRTDLVFDYLAEGHAATSADKDGVSLIKWCAYFRDVSGELSVRRYSPSEPTRR